jgi:hypothetical protein
LKIGVSCWQASYSQPKAGNFRSPGPLQDDAPKIVTVAHQKGG